LGGWGGYDTNQYTSRRIVCEGEVEHLPSLRECGTMNSPSD